MQEPEIPSDPNATNKGKKTFFENMKRFYKNKGNKKLLEKITIKANDFTYHAVEIIGNGSFGIVFKAIVDGTNKNVAIKKVLQDRRFKNRELQIMKTLDHRNIISLENSFFTTGGSDKHNDDLYLNLVMEYIPETLYRLIRYFHKNNLEIPPIYIKVYMYQLFRGLAYIHSIGICHRDIKPQNLLIDPKHSIVKICDFGSAKNLVPDKPSVAYICSRYYRAPELIFGATFYTNAIDLWSMGCVMAELFLGEPLFPGESAIDQLVEIIKVLGTPTEEQIYSMNENYTEFNFPQIKPNSWEKVLESTSICPQAIDLLSKILVYSPVVRYDAFTSMAHPYFDELRQPDCKLPDQQNLPELFDFSIQEVKSMGPQLAKKIIPNHIKLGFKVDDCF